MIFELEARYDARKSFYGKAQIDEKPDGTKILYSYGTAVSQCSPEETQLEMIDGQQTYTKYSYRTA